MTTEQLIKDKEQEAAMISVRLQMKQQELTEKMNRLQQHDIKLMCVLEDLINDCLNLTAKKFHIAGFVEGLNTEKSVEAVSEDEKESESVIDVAEEGQPGASA